MTTGVASTPHLEIGSPIGDLLLVASPAGIARVAFDDEDWDDELSSLATLLHSGPTPLPRKVDDDVQDLLEGAHQQLDQYFAGNRRCFDVPVDLSLTNGFTRRTLDYLRTIEFGSVTSYGHVAEAIGSPRAARAVGSACSDNPVPILVPCHRVLTAAGCVGGYLGGQARKEFILDLEHRTMQQDERKP